MKQTKAFLIVFILLFIGCATQGIQPVTPVDRALILFDQYMALEETYKSHYIASTVTEQENLSQNVAPVLDRMRQLITVYSKVALSGTDDTTTRLEIVQLGRTAALSLTRSIAE